MMYVMTTGTPVVVLVVVMVVVVPLRGRCEYDWTQMWKEWCSV